MRFCCPRWRAPRLVWTVGGGATYGMPVAWVNTAGPAAPSGPGDAHALLRNVLGYTGSLIVEAACAWMPVSRGAVGADGLIADPSIRRQIPEVLTTLARATSASEEAALGAAGALDVVPFGQSRCDRRGC
jgi:hypothetical protein